MKFANAAAAKKAMETLVATAENENRPMTEAELAEFDAASAEFDVLAAAEAEGAAERAAATQARREAIAAATDRMNATRATAIAAAASPGRHAAPAAREFESLGDFVAAAVTRPNDPRLAAHYRERNPEAADDMSTSSGSTGGFLIPPVFINRLMETAAAATIVRSRAMVLPAGATPDAPVTIPALDQDGTNPQNSYGGIQVTWIAEGGEKPKTDAKFRQITLEPKEVAGHVVVTDKMLRNAPVLGAFLARTLPAALYSAEDVAFINGNGIGKPLGFIGSGAAYAVTRSGSPATVEYDDVVEMISRAKGENLIFIAAKGLFPTIAKMQDPSGQYIWVAGSNGGARDAVPGTLLGYPVIFTERAPAAGEKGDLALVDLMQYLVKDGVGVTIAASEHVEFINNKTVVKAFMTTDGQPWMKQPFVGLDGREYSPFVVLD